MSEFNRPHKPGSRCRTSGRYRVYRLTRIGLQPTRYRRDVSDGNTFPPAPGKGEVFILEVPFEMYDGGQLPLFSFNAYLDDGDGLPMAA